MKSTEKTDYDQDDVIAKDRLLTLSVKAKELYNQPYPPPVPIVDDYTALIDDEGFGSTYGSETSDYTTPVFRQRKMVWEIKSDNLSEEDREYPIALLRVTHNPGEGNPNFFAGDGTLNAVNGKITGTISNDPKLIGKEDSYTIHFTISFGGKLRKYQLDPRLKINQ